MSNIKKYKKKPVIIEAIQWDGENEIEIMNFIGSKLRVSKPPRILELEQDFIDNYWELEIPTLEDGNKIQVKHIANKKDWIIKGIKGEFYPCKPDIFKDTYELVSPLQQNKVSDPSTEQSTSNWQTVGDKDKFLDEVRGKESDVNAEEILQNNLTKINKGNSSEIQFCYKAIFSSMEEYASIVRKDNVVNDAVEIIEELIFLKKYKDLNGKDGLYLTRQPKVWETAQKFLNHNLKNLSNEKFLKDAVNWFITEKAPDLKEKIDNALLLVGNKLPLEEKHRKLFGFIIFDYSMLKSYGSPLFFIAAERCATEIGVLEEMKYYANDWINHSKNKKQ